MMLELGDKVVAVDQVTGSRYPATVVDKNNIYVHVKYADPEFFGDKRDVYYRDSGWRAWDGETRWRLEKAKGRLYGPTCVSKRYDTLVWVDGRLVRRTIENRLPHGVRRPKAHQLEYWGVDLRHMADTGEYAEMHIYVCTATLPDGRMCGVEQMHSRPR